MKQNGLFTLFAVTIVAVFLSTFRLDSYISKPGGAYELEPLVEVENGDEDDEGSLSLMTVSVMPATPALYVWAQLGQGYKVLSPEQLRSPHESDEEYNVRQLQLMSDSQVNAIQTAYREAGKPFEVTHNGVFVLNIFPGAAAADALEPGDRILSIDGNLYESQEAFTEYLQNKEDGEAVELEIERNGSIIEETVQLAPIPGNPEQIGLGIAFAEDKSIETTPEVTIDSDDIGGPSAGLMFTLEILNQLLDEDISKGYNVAGTGTMSSEGEVGPIGGIDQKVIAADAAGVEIFFAPSIKVGGAESNYETAVKTAEEIGTEMEIVPVETIDDALSFLEGLQPK